MVVLGRYRLGYVKRMRVEMEMGRHDNERQQYLAHTDNDILPPSSTH
jgi:hypothetical protein